MSAGYSAIKLVHEFEYTVAIKTDLNILQAVNVEVNFSMKITLSWIKTGTGGYFGSR